MKQYLRSLLISFLMAILCCQGVQAEESAHVPVLAYHRLGPSVKDGMTIKTAEFEAQMKWLKDHGYQVIPLKMLVSYLRGEGPTPPSKSVVITADDGHISVYKEMQPIIKKYKFPVTLFIYPSAISHASYAMSWEQLHELQQTGLFDIQGHTYWHPNFKKEMKKLKPDEYQKFVALQLNKSKQVLEKKLNTKVELLAWPFGIYNDQLEQEAQKDGYVAAFSIDARPAKKSEKMMSQPRFMIVHATGLKGFETIMATAHQVDSPISDQKK